jgi:type IV pilus assembly protein PilA
MLTRWQLALLSNVSGLLARQKTLTRSNYVSKYSQSHYGQTGFTLIELLVVIIIIGILAAIALPTFLNQANKAKQSEAKTYLGSMNRAQQAYYMENSIFADNPNFGELGLGFASQTNYYLFMISGGGSTVTNQARPGSESSLNAYIGGLKVGVAFAGGEANALSVLCEGTLPPVVGGPDGTESASFAAVIGLPDCPTGYQPVK